MMMMMMMIIIIIIITVVLQIDVMFYRDIFYTFALDKNGSTYSLHNRNC